MLPIVDLGCGYYLVDRRKVIFGITPDAFSVLDRDEVLRRIAEKSHVCSRDSITETDFDCAYGFDALEDDPAGARWGFCMYSSFGELPESVQTMLRKEFPDHAGLI